MNAFLYEDEIFDVLMADDIVVDDKPRIPSAKLIHSAYRKDEVEISRGGIFIIHFDDRLAVNIFDFDLYRHESAVRIVLGLFVRFLHMRQVVGVRCIRSVAPPPGIFK